MKKTEKPVCAYFFSSHECVTVLLWKSSKKSGGSVINFIHKVVTIHYITFRRSFFLSFNKLSVTFSSFNCVNRRWLKNAKALRVCTKRSPFSCFELQSESLPSYDSFLIHKATKFLLFIRMNSDVKKSFYWFQINTLELRGSRKNSEEKQKFLWGEVGQNEIFLL
jgi:hypothetical protein